MSNTLPVRQITDDDDVYWMKKALALAEQAAEKGEVPVGAIVVKEGKVIAATHNLREKTGDPVAHAEILAIQSASERLGNWRLTDTILYVTLEPCPMCAGAIVLARIPRVVYATSDPKTGAAGSLYNIVQDDRLNHQVELVSGVCAEESAKILKLFFKNRRKEQK